MSQPKNILITKTGQKIVTKLQENSRVKTRSNSKMSSNFEKVKLSAQNSSLAKKNSLNTILSKINKKFLKHLRKDIQRILISDSDIKTM
jgi:hypothetical protein